MDSPAPLLSFALKNVVLFILIVLIVHLLIKNAVNEKRFLTGDDAEKGHPNDDAENGVDDTVSKKSIEAEIAAQSVADSVAASLVAKKKRKSSSGGRSEGGFPKKGEDEGDDDDLYRYVFSSALDDENGDVRDDNGGDDEEDYGHERRSTTVLSKNGSKRPSSTTIQKNAPSNVVTKNVPVDDSPLTGSGLAAANDVDAQQRLTTSLNDSTMNGGAVLMKGLQCANVFDQGYSQFDI